MITQQNSTVFPFQSVSPTSQSSSATTHADEHGPVITPLDILLPYQKAWVNDSSRFKLGLMARQVGKSFACAAEAVCDCLLNPPTTWLIVSAGERQALEFMEKVKQWSRAFQEVVEYDKQTKGHSVQALIKNAEVRWKNGSRIIALPANADTIRGYSANLILDEFAFHEKPEKIWRAIYPSISNPLSGSYKLRIISTPNGKSGKFFDLWNNAKSGTFSSAKANRYTRHLVTIHDAIAAGLPLDIEELRTGLDDPDGWAQEFECQFIDTATVLLPYELLESCESADATEVWKEKDLYSASHYFLGIDIGRKHDQTVAWVLEKVGDILWTRAVVVLEKQPFHLQMEVIEPLSRHALHTCIDSTGLGAMLAEELQRLRGSTRVEVCPFTSELKQEIFTQLRRHFEKRNLRIPISRAIREDLHALQKTVTSTGLIRYCAPHRNDGHSDRATALALALRAAQNASAAMPFTPLPTPSRMRRSREARSDRTTSI